MFYSLFNLIDVTTISNIVVMSQRMMLVIHPLMGALVSCYALYLAYRAFFDSQNLMILESLHFMFSLFFVTTMALSLPWYLGHIVPFVLSAGDGIANALVDPVSTSSAGTLQLMFNKVMIQITTLWNSFEFSIYEPSSIGYAFLVIQQVAFLIIGFAIFFSICAAYLLIAKVMVSMLLIIGPLFIMLAFFPSTRDLFKAWTGQCFNYILLSILFPIAFSLFEAILNATVFSGSINAANNYTSFFLYLILSFVAIQIPTLASSLSGGVGISGIVGNITSTLGSLKRLTSSARKPNNNQPTLNKPKNPNIKAG